MEFTVAGTYSAGFLPGLVPDEVAQAAGSELGTRDQVQGELDVMLDVFRSLYEREPDDVMRVCSALSARLTQLYVLLHRVEARDRQYKQVRTQQVVPMLDEVERQYRLASRIVEVRRQDMELLK